MHKFMYSLSNKYLYVRQNNYIIDIGEDMIFGMETWTDINVPYRYLLPHKESNV